MKPEQRYWTRIAAHLRRAGFRVDRVENVVLDGMPDVFGVSHEYGRMFWLELKYRDVWPLRLNTRPLGEKRGLRKSQKVWLWDVSDRTHSAYILFGVGDSEHFLIPGVDAYLVNQMTRETLEQYRVSLDELVEILEAGR